MTERTDIERQIHEETVRHYEAVMDEYFGGNFPSMTERTDAERRQHQQRARTREGAGMKLQVCFVDSWGYWNTAQLTGPATPRRRIVEIELTAEQVAMMEPRSVGMNGKAEMREDVEWIQVKPEDAP